MRFWRAGTRTFGSILQENRGAGPGFDLLRLALSLTIVASHCSFLAGNRGGVLSQMLQDLLQFVWPSAGGLAPAVPQVPATVAQQGGDLFRAAVAPVTGLARPYTMSHVPMFFALSGFLVSGSAFRTKRVLPFLGLRVIRILPALVVEVALSALVLGAVFTTLPLSDYFTSGGFYSYFTNIVGIIKFTLPGVFEQNSQTNVVNANLWTLPAEFYCYLIAAALIVTGVIFNRTLMTTVFVVASVGFLIANTFFGYKDVSGILDGEVNVYYFFVGVMLYLWKDHIPYSIPLFCVVVVACYALMMSTRTVYIYPLLLAYITMFIGLSALPRIPLLKTGDYSYGIYLYGFPITQALVAAVPAVRGNLPVLLGATIVLTGVFSVLSWHLVEKRFLVFKKYLSARSTEITAQLHPGAVRAEPSARGDLARDGVRGGLAP